MTNLQDQRALSSVGGDRHLHGGLDANEWKVNTSPHRDAAHDINIVASWLPGDGDADRHIDWVRRFFDALSPHSKGVYVNFTSDDADQRARMAYTERQWARLATLKAKYDPDNFFHMNANIRPAGT